MATTALGVMQDGDGNGVDPLTHRRIIMGRWENTGIVSGLSVSGTSSLTYQVSAGNAVLSRGDSDGYTEAYWEGGTTDAVSAGDASRPRVDLVWMRANDAQQGDADNRVHVGVTEGTASASPVAPGCPSGCVELAQMLVPAGATSTASATNNADQNYAVPYGASLGQLAYYRDTTSGDIDSTSRVKTTRCSVSVTVPTDRLVELRMTASVACRGVDPQYCSWYTSFSVDGSELPYSGGEFYLNCLTCEALQRSFTTELAAGTHSVAVLTAWVSGTAGPMVRSGSYSEEGGSASGFSGSFPGIILEVWDKGVAK